MLRDYLIENYGYSFDPPSVVTEFHTRNRRQRVLYQNRDTIFTVSERLNSTEFAAFEDWVNTTLNGGVDSYTGAYWDGDLERSGTLTIVNGEYSFIYNSAADIVVTYQVELKARDLTDGENIYGLVDGGYPFDSRYYNIFEEMINRNNFA